MATTTTTTTLPGFQQGPVQDAVGKASNIFAGGAPDISASSAIGANAVSGYQDAAGHAGSLVPGVLDATNFLLNDARNPASNPAFQEYLKISNDDIARSFAEQVLPYQKQGQVLSGGLGSSRSAVEGSFANQDLFNSLQTNSAQLTNAAYGQGLNATIAGIGLTPTAQGAAGAPANFLNAAAGAQYGLDTGEYNLENQHLNNYINQISGNYGGTQTTTGPKSSSGGISGALGGLSSGAGVLSALGGAGAWNPYILAGTAVLGAMQ